MAENKFRTHKNEKQSGKGFFGFLSSGFNTNDRWGGGLPVKHLPKVAFAVAIGIFYVWNSHYAERTNRAIEQMENKVKDLRADVTTLEADYMFSSKQSEVAKKVEALGLKESIAPPIKIIVDDNEY